MKRFMLMVVGLLAAVYNLFGRFVRLANPVKTKHKRVKIKPPEWYAELSANQTSKPRKKKRLPALFVFRNFNPRTAVYETKAGGFLIAKVVGSDGNGGLLLRRRRNDGVFRRQLAIVA